METKPGIVRIPIRAKYQVKDGKVSFVSAEYADASADEIARYLLQKFRVDIGEAGAGDIPAPQA